MTDSLYNGFYYHKRNYHLGKKSHRVCTVFSLFSFLKQKQESYCIKWNIILFKNLEFCKLFENMTEFSWQHSFKTLGSRKNQFNDWIKYVRGALYCELSSCHHFMPPDKQARHQEVFWSVINYKWCVNTKPFLFYKENLFIRAKTYCVRA